MNITLWMAQVLLGLVFMTTGIFKVFFYEKSREHLKIAQVAPKRMVRTIGVLEILGALGVILPTATGILPWLTPVAAIGLALIMIGAMGFNVKNSEASHTPMNIILLLTALFVVYGRFVIAPL
jgi:uncharacterized membrane protein YphA (DoxX/SURF4 family)